MPDRFSRTVLVCLTALFTITCTKTEQATAPTATQSQPPQGSASASAPTPPPLCAKSVTDCNGKQQCATAPLTAAAANIPTGTRCIPDGEGGNPAQQYIDAFSWNLFLALNWPANTGNCAADTAKSIVDVQSGDGTNVVWQTYMPSDRVFVNPGFEKPAAWCSGNGLSGGANRLFDKEAKAVAEARELGGAFLKISEPGKDVLQAAGGVVTDQSGRWLRYEKLMNEVEYRYITDANQGKWNMPLLEAMQKAGTPIRIPPNSMELKAAWKVLTQQEIDSKKYFTTQGMVCNTPDGQRTPCDEKPVTFGLVGLHIVQQVTDGGTMFWATFEQKDNDTVFFNPASNSTPNTDLAKQPYVELDANCKPLNLPTQIKRETPIPADPTLNAYYQQLLGNSVFSNYRLISTQWTTGLSTGGTPSNVANITLETYVQTLSTGSGIGTATGCMACHANATTRVKGQSSNHSFFFLAAKYATMPPKSGP
jgi:hypothetical protein